MNGKNPLHEKIKEKINQHEFDFDSKAWGDMESLLDKQMTASPFEKVKSFLSTNKVLGLVTILAIGLLLTYQWENNDAPIAHKSNALKKTTNDVINTVKEQNDTKTAFRNNTLQDKNSTTAVKSNAVVNLFNNVGSEKTDTNKIRTAVNNYASYFQNEKVYLQLDKTIYKPDEAIWFNVFVRNGRSFLPSKSEIVHVELIAPNGKVLKVLSLLAKNGMAAGDFQLTDDYVGGLYKLKAYTSWQKNTNDFFEKTLQIQKTVLPNLNMKLDFAREAYGAGDEVQADLSLETLANAPLVNKQFRFTVSLAGQQIISKEASTDKVGKANISFQLPNDLTTNDGLLNVLINYNNSTESIARSIPIVLNKIDLQFLPEGGELPAGIESNIAFKAINEFGQPADIAGEIYNANGEKVQSFQSYHDGMGSFLFLAKANEKYTAKITQPAGIKERFELPTAKADAVSINITKQTNSTITLRVSSNIESSFVLAVSAREKVYSTYILTDLKGEKLVKINTKDLPIGIATLTLFDINTQPVAERLVFVNPHQKLNIDIKTDKEQYKLRETVKTTITVTDEKGKPVKGQFAVSVVDKNLLTHADDKQANILAYYLLTADLNGTIKEPNFYFEPQEKTDKVNRKKALDYVLLTHGWRKFNWEQLMAGNYPRFSYPFETTKYQGQIIDAFNRPLANATVSVEHPRKGTITSTVTDAHGRFILEKVALLPPFTIKASYDKVSDTKIIQSYSQNCRMKLMANFVRDIYGRVIDYRSHGLEHFTVEIVGKTAPNLSTQTDKDGNWRISNVDFSKYSEIILKHKDGSNQRLNLANYATGRTVLFQTQLNKVSDLTGKVVRADETLIEGATVWLYGRQDTVQTNRLGEFTIPNVDFSQPLSLSALFENRIVTNTVVKSVSPVITFHNNRKIDIREGDDVTDTPKIIGKVFNDNNEPLIGATVLIYQNRQFKYGATADFNGEYLIQNLPKGRYDIQVNILGYDDVWLQDVNLEDRNLKIDFPMHSQPNFNEVIVVQYDKMNYSSISVPVESITTFENNAIEAGFAQRVPTAAVEPALAQQSAVNVIAKKEIRQMPTRDVSNIASTAVRINPNEGLTLRGRHSNDNVYYIDGIRVSGNLIPQDEIEQIQLITGGTPASIGDENGGLTAVPQRTINFYTNQDNEQVELPQNRFLIDVENENFYNNENEAYDINRAMVDYGRAAKFERGYYQSRTFYVPKYGKKTPKIRNDFRTTLYWSNTVETDKNGKAEFEFPNADATTNYTITVAGFSEGGDIGLNTTDYFVQMPFELQTKIPNSVLTGDRLIIPLTLVNNTSEAISGRLNINVPRHFESLNIIDDRVKLKPKEVKVIKLEYLIGSDVADGNLYFEFNSKDFKDAFTTTIQTITSGYPVNKVMANNQKYGDFEFDISDAIPGTANIQLTVHPNVISDLVTGIERMFRQPNGCFEQVSSSNYPNLLALNYLRNTNFRNQKVEAQAERYLEIGYQKMISYEVDGGGFDWWGKAPAHEGLTAYGLMQLVDMSAVFDVDEQLISRTAKWLLSRRDNEGGWIRKQHALHTWVGEDLVFNNYIIWGLAEAGYGKDILKEINANYQPTIQSENPYIMALMANTLLIIEDDRAEELMDALLKMQHEKGFWNGINRSITGSGGTGLDIETTALVALAIIKMDEHEAALRTAIDYLAKAKNQYGFGSTQSTVLALKALVEYAQYAQKTDESGQVILYRGNTIIGEYAYEAGMTEPIVFDSLQQYFTKDINKLKVRFDGVSKALPYDLSINYFTRLPQNNLVSKVQIETTIENTKAMIGETVRMQVTLKHNAYEVLSNPIAVVGIPSGLSLQPWQLRELQEKNVADYIELWNGYIVFYFRELTNDKTINLDLKAEAAGTFEAPASSAYLYYDNEFKSWSLPQKIDIQ